MDWHVTFVPPANLPITQAAVQAKLRQALSVAKSITPIDTGFMESSWYVTGNFLINDASYASFVDQGTSKMSGYFISDEVVGWLENSFADGDIYL